MIDDENYSPLKSSELILNPDGSVYHLGLKAGDVAQNVITVGDPERVGVISKRFDRTELKMARREFVTHTGVLSGKRLTVISTGIGTDNIDIVLNELHALFKMPGEADFPHYNFVRIGTSGAVREEIPVDSVLSSEAAIGMDGLLHFYNFTDEDGEVERLWQSNEAWQNLPKPYAAFAGKELFSQFSPISERQGVTLTAPGFYAPQGRTVNLRPKVENFTQLLSRSAFAGKPITNIEMETAGIYGLAHLLGHQAVSLSAILANRITGEFSKKPEKTVEKLIEAVLQNLL